MDVGRGVLDGRTVDVGSGVFVGVGVLDGVYVDVGVNVVVEVREGVWVVGVLVGVKVGVDVRDAV